MENEVCSRYYASEFLGIASAKDILSSFIKCISKLDASKLIQVSSDGPNVNLAFLELMNDKRNEEALCKLIDLGTCGLHVLHGSFETWREKFWMKIDETAFIVV